MATLGKKAAPAKTQPKTQPKAAAEPAPKKGFPAKKAAGKKVAGKTVARAPAPTFEAPADMKPAFFEFQFTTGEDGLMVPSSIQMSRVRGKWDNTDAPRYDMLEYDRATLTAVATRIAGVTFAPNILRRLPVNTAFFLVIRASKKADGNLTAAIRFGRHADASAAKMRWKWFEDPKQEVWGPVWRKIRRASRMLPSAFVDVQLPPSKRRKSDDE